MSGRVSLPDSCSVGHHEAAIVHRSGGQSASTHNRCGKCGREIERAFADDPWRTPEQREEHAKASRRASDRSRVYGTVMCQGCNETVDVIYPISDSEDAIGLIDHVTPHGTGERCQHAGLNIWTKDGGWREALHRGRYGEETITRVASTILEERARESSGPIDGQAGFDGSAEKDPDADELLPCLECGGTRFAIDAVRAVTEYIELNVDGEDFQVYDTYEGDSEWEDMGRVRCVRCNHTMQYSDWRKREQPTAEATETN